MSKNKWLGLSIIFFLLLIVSIAYYKNRLTTSWLESINFTDILVRPNELPDGFVSGTYERIEPNPEYDQFVVHITQEIQTHNHDRVGSVTVLVCQQQR
jgi:hypothetical protein